MAHPGSKTADIWTTLFISVSLKLHTDNNPVVIRPVAIVYIVTANIASVDLSHLCQTRQGTKSIDDVKKQEGEVLSVHTI